MELTQESTIDNINFFRNNVMNISDATRKNKLASVLEEFSTEEKNQKIYIIQNSKKKEAAGVISSLNDYLAKEEMLRALQNEVLRLSEENLKLKVQQREQSPSLSFTEAMNQMEFDESDWKDIFNEADEVNID